MVLNAVGQILLTLGLVVMLISLIMKLALWRERYLGPDRWTNFLIASGALLVVFGAIALLAGPN